MQSDRSEHDGSSTSASYPPWELIGHFYTEARARDLVRQFVDLGHARERFLVERDEFGEWRVYSKR